MFLFFFYSPEKRISISIKIFFTPGNHGCESSSNHLCVKSVQILSFFWSAFSCIRTEYRKIRSRKYFCISALFKQSFYKSLPAARSSLDFFGCSFRGLVSIFCLRKLKGKSHRSRDLTVINL